MVLTTVAALVAINWSGWEGAGHVDASGSGGG